MFNTRAGPKFPKFYNLPPAITWQTRARDLMGKTPGDYSSHVPSSTNWPHAAIAPKAPQGEEPGNTDPGLKTLKIPLDFLHSLG